MHSLPKLLLLPLAFHLAHVHAACPAPLAAVDNNATVVEGDPKCPDGKEKFEKPASLNLSDINPSSFRPGQGCCRRRWNTRYASVLL